MNGDIQVSPEFASGLTGVVGVVVGGVISWLLQRDRSSADMTIALEAIKTEHMAERTALYYLSHKGYTDRSFELLRKRLGGFDGDELRRILVRAGAVRYIRDDGSEWWCLLSRSSEAGKRGRVEGAGNDDL
jgi:5-bromo-4-chloroindolyl phosphate hydrolysis protein